MSPGVPRARDRALLAAPRRDPRADGVARRARRRARRRSRRSRPGGARTTACPSTGCASEWRARAAEHGLDRAALSRALRPRAGRGVCDASAWPSGSKGRTGSRGTVRRSRAATCCRRSPSTRATARPSRASRRSADAFLARDGIVELEPVAGERRYTTRELLQLERAAARARASGAATASGRGRRASARRLRSPAAVDERRSSASSSRRSPARRGVEVVRAPAGTGKTFALDAAREAWQASGVAVLGCALSARAARELRDQAGHRRRPPSRGSRTRSTAGCGSPAARCSSSTRPAWSARATSRGLLDAAEHARAKLVLVGDDRQLPEIEAGGAVPRARRPARRARADGGPPAARAVGPRRARRTARRRRRALRPRVPRARPDRRRADRGGGARAARRRLAGRRSERGEQALMIAHRRRDVADLNDRAREPARARAHRRRRARRPTSARSPSAIASSLAATTGGSASSTATPARSPRSPTGGIAVTLDDGRTLELPRPTRAPGTSTTATPSPPTWRRARPSIAPSCSAPRSSTASGATPRSRRHRDEARFYVSATPDVPQPQPPSPEHRRRHDARGHADAHRAAARSDSRSTASRRIRCVACSRTTSSDARGELADIDARLSRAGASSATACAGTSEPPGASSMRGVEAGCAASSTGSRKSERLTRRGRERDQS